MLLIRSFCENFVKLKHDLNQYHLIFVDDGSTRNVISDQYIDEIKNSFPFVDFIQLSRNFGQHTAILVGIKFSLEGSDIIGFMNVDQEDPIEEIPKLVDEMMRTKSECITSLRSTREKKFFRDLTSWFFHSILNYLTGSDVPQNCSTLRIYSSEGAKRLLKYWSYRPYIPGMEHLAALNIGYLSTRQQVRAEGTSSYNFKRRLKFALDVILNFSDFPLKLCIYAGAIIALLGFVLGANLIFSRMFGIIQQSGYTSTTCLIIFFGGLQILTLGIIGLYVGKMFENAKGYPLYHIKNRQG